MPRKKQITKCRAASGCGQKVLEGGCFCADHELLWIAKTGSTSERIRTKHAKMYQQFKRQQERAQEARVEQSYRNWGNRVMEQMQQQKSRIFPALNQNLVEMRVMLDKLSGVNDVHDATLHGLGESHQADALGYLIGQGLDDGGTDPRQAGSGGPIADEPDRDVEEGQPEVSGVHVHRSV